MILRYFVFAALGKLLMMFIRKFPPAVRIAERIHFPIDCDLCLGWWVYTVSSFAFPVQMMDSYTPIINELIQGSVTAWVAYVFTAGWHSTYSVYEVKTDANG